MSLAVGAWASPEEGLHCAERQYRVAKTLDKLNRASKQTREVAAHAAAVEERLREPPQSVAREADGEEYQEKSAPAMPRDCVQRALRVGRRAARAQGERDRESTHDAEADALRGEAGAA